MEEETGMEVGRGVGRSGGEGREVGEGGDGGEVWEGEGDGEEGEEVRETADPFSSIFLEKWVVKKFSSGAHLRESYFPPFKHFLSHQTRVHDNIQKLHLFFSFFYIVSIQTGLKGPSGQRNYEKKEKKKNWKKGKKKKKKILPF